MNRALVCCFAAMLGVMVVVESAAPRKTDRSEVHLESLLPPDAPLPPDLVNKPHGASRAAAAADTFVLHSADFQSANGQPDAMGYVSVDLTDQIAVFFHVADGTELAGGAQGNLLPLSGSRSMWCGQAPSTAPPFCGYAALPGYGNDWDQILESDPLPGDSLAIAYNVSWDSEGGYDGTTVEYTFDGGATWTEFPIANNADIYDDTGPTPYLAESFTARSPGAANARVRFRFKSDNGWSDEDGLWPTDGALVVDDIIVNTWSGGVAATTNAQDFESIPVGSKAAGIWTGKKPPSFGDFAALYAGVSLLQEDECSFVTDFVWGFFDHPSSTNYSCHLPDPRPDVGAVPFGNEDGEYIRNEIWSPPFANSGSGGEYIFQFLVYLDNPLDNLIFHTWGVRSWIDPDGPGPLPSCPGRWRGGNTFLPLGTKRWVTSVSSIGNLVDPAADQLQITLGVTDQCLFWCGIFGSGACHSHAPLFDSVRVVRVAQFGPQYTVRHVDLFQDTFADDGTLTGIARADAALDVLPRSNPGILPGDSVAVTIRPVGIDAGGGPAAYCYARVQNVHAPKSGGSLGSSDTRVGKVGPRWPYKGSTAIGGDTWEVFQMDNCVTSSSATIADRFCVDLNDHIFVPGDTVWYFLCADADGTPNNGTENYWHRAFDGQGASRVTDDRAQAAASPCEFTILPAGGYNAGGDILYVDNQDDRGGPGQLYFDSAFDMLGILDLVDRYDVLGPSSNVNNSLASRVTDTSVQIVDVYEKILWDSGNLSSGLVGDGTGNPEKSNDWGLIFTFLNTGNLGPGPGLYLSGDDMAQEWVTLAGAGAIQSRSVYMNFNLFSNSHIITGEPISPHLTAAGASFIHSGVPDELVVFGGCPIVNDFDVLDPTGASITEYPYPATGDGAVISMRKTNNATPIPKTATVVLSGFSYSFIRDAAATFPPARVEFMRDLLIKMGNVIPNATGVDPGDASQYANALYDNYPNPFNPTTTIRYSIKERGHVSLNVYNAAGQVVRTLVDEVQSPAAIQLVTWDGSNNAGQTVSSGVYFYRLLTKNFSQTKKLVLLK